MMTLVCTCRRAHGESVAHALRADGFGYLHATTCPLCRGYGFRSRRLGTGGTYAEGHAECSCGASSPHLGSRTHRIQWYDQHVLTRA
jgi:hypothetical protein